MGTEYQNGDSLYVVAVKILKKLSGSLGGEGGGGGDPFIQANYITTSAHPDLTSERVLTGTDNRVSVQVTSGNAILSTPQDSHTEAQVQYDRIGLGTPPQAEEGSLKTSGAAYIGGVAHVANTLFCDNVGGTSLEAAGNIVGLSDASFLGNLTVAGNYLAPSFHLLPIAGQGVTLTRSLGDGELYFNLGGSTSAYPALKRSGADLHVRLADNSAFTDLHLAEIFASGGQVDTLLTDVLSVNTSISLLTGATILSDNGTLSDNGAGFTIAGDTIFSTIVTAQGGILSHGNVIPNAGNSHDLGTSTTFKWRDLYLGRNGIGATATDSLYLTNETDAAAGAQQYSPALRFRGQGWKTDATAASRPTDLRIYALPIQGAANPTVRLMFDASVNGAAFANLMHLENNGTLTVAGTVVSSTHIVAGAAASLSMFLRAKFTSPADSVMTISNNAVTDFNRLQFGGTTSSFPALKRVSAELQVRLADDSADGDLKSRQITTSSTDFIHETSAALADGAGAQAGTITNAPSAGNPTKWIAINDNGTTRYIPTWT